MARRHNVHFTALHVAQEARRGKDRADDHDFAQPTRERWTSAGNLSFDDVPIVQPMQRIVCQGCDGAGGSCAGCGGTGFFQRSTSAGAETRVAADANRIPWTGGAKGASVSGPLTLILPFPPTVNHSTMPKAGGGKYLTPDHQAFRSSVAWIVKQRRLARIDGRLRVLIELYPDSNRRWDIDNRCKAVLDALQHAGLFVSDEAVDDLRITRQIAGNEAWCSVTIERLNDGR